MMDKQTKYEHIKTGTKITVKEDTIGCRQYHISTRDMTNAVFTCRNNESSMVTKSGKDYSEINRHALIMRLYKQGNNTIEQIIFKTLCPITVKERYGNQYKESKEYTNALHILRGILGNDVNDK